MRSRELEIYPLMTSRLSGIVLNGLVVVAMLSGCSSKQGRVIERDIAVPSPAPQVELSVEDKTVLPVVNVRQALAAPQETSSAATPEASETVVSSEAASAELSEVDQILSSTSGITRPPHEVKARERVLQDLLQE